MAKLEIKINHNSNDEENIYGKMFFKNEKKTCIQESVSDFVEKNKIQIQPLKTTIEIEVENDLLQIEKEVKELIVLKKKELSFDVNEGKDAIDPPEIEQLSSLIEDAVRNLGVCKKLGKEKEYSLFR